MPYQKMAWLTVVLVCLITAILFLVSGYQGYALLAVAIGLSAAINLR